MKTIVTMTLVGLTLASGLVGPSLAASRGAILLGEQRFKCKKGWVALLSTPRRTIPPAKYEAVTVRVPNGILRYTCGTRPGQIICPIDTTIISIRRGVIGGTFRVECRGIPFGIPGAKVPEGDGSAVPETPAANQ